MERVGGVFPPEHVVDRRAVTLAVRERPSHPEVTWASAAHSGAFLPPGATLRSAMRVKPGQMLSALLEQIGAVRLLGAIQRGTETLSRVLGSRRVGTVAFWALVTAPAAATLGVVLLV
jgi:hypothetical protein